MENVVPKTEQVLMTADELFELPEDGWSYELVEGRLIRMSPTDAGHGYIVMELLAVMHRFVHEHHLGTLFPAETGFRLSPEGAVDTVLAPDVAFVAAGRAPDRSFERYPHLAPDLVVEVVSPSQSRTELRAKAGRWLGAGVRVVWIVVPRRRTVEVWRHGRMEREVSEGEELSGEDVLPGFVLPISTLFA